MHHYQLRIKCLCEIGTETLDVKSKQIKHSRAPGAPMTGIERVLDSNGEANSSTSLMQLESPRSYEAKM